MNHSTVERHTLTLQQSCDVPRITRGTAMRLSGCGELAVFKVGQAWRVDARDLDAFIQRQKHAAQQGGDRGNVVWAR